MWALEEATGKLNQEMDIWADQVLITDFITPLWSEWC